MFSRRACRGGAGYSKWNGSEGLPLALRPKVEKELERLVEDIVIQPVQFSEWAAFIVQTTGSVRICGYGFDNEQVCKNGRVQFAPY